MDRMHRQVFDKKKKARHEFHQIQFRNITTSMENCAARLRKDRRENVISIRRAKVLEEMFNTSSQEHDIESKIIVKFLQEKSFFMGQDVNSV